MSIKGMARSGSEGNTRLQKMYGAGSTPPRQDYPKGYATGGAVKAYATGGMISDTAEGMPSKPNLGRPGRKMGKGKAKASGKGTNVNVVIMPKPDMPKPDMAAGAPPAGPGPMPMPPPGAGGPPMPMRAKGGRVSGQDTPAERESMKSMGRKSGGKVMKHDDAAEDRKMIKSMVKPNALKRAEGGEVDEDDQREYQVAGKFSGLSRAAGAAAKAAGSASKGASGAAKVVPKVAPSARDVGNVILESEALMNGTPGAPIGTGRRAVWDGLNLMTRKKPSDQQKDDPNQQPPQKKKEGGAVLKMHAGAGSGVGRIEKEKKQKRA